MTQNPLFSFIATSRNDDHGGDVLRRTQSFLNRLAEQCERHQVPSELILVEWNPPPARPSLEEVLAWPAGSKWFAAQIAVVPPHLHSEFRYSARLPLFQMIAKNVGIRRASGQFVIATNIDIIFSDHLFESLKRGWFREGILYRSNRWDIPNAVQFEPDLDQLLQRAQQEAIRYHLKDGTFIKHGDAFVRAKPSRFDDLFYNPLNESLQSIKGLATETPGNEKKNITVALNELVERELPQLRRSYQLPDVHINGCGDFTMLSREDWLALRGYPEWNLFSWNIDAVLVLQAHLNGIRVEEMDPSEVHYHIEHGHGSGWTPEGEETLWTRLDQRGIPYMSFNQYTELVYELQDNAERNLFTIYNGADWGLAGREVDVRMVVAEGSPAQPPTMVNSAPLREDFFADLTPLDLGQAYDQAFRPAEGARVAFSASDDGGLEIAVETRPERWSYAVELDLSGVAASGRECWLQMSISIAEGSVGICLLNPEHTHFTHERLLHGPHKAPQEVLLRVKDLGQCGNLVFRNSTPGGRPARFTIRQLQLLGERRAPGELPLVGDRPVAPANPVADAVEPAAWPGLSAMRAGSRGAVVRVLAPRGAGSNGHALDHQILVVTPAEHGAWGGLLDLPVGAGAGKLTLDLHVIAGIVGIGVSSSITAHIVAEQCAPEGPPFTRVDLGLADAGGPGVLVIRNLSQAGPAKVLIHQLDYSDGTNV